MKKQGNNKEDYNSESKTQSNPNSIPGKNKLQPSKSGNLQEKKTGAQSYNYQANAAQEKSQPNTKPADQKDSGKSNQINNSPDRSNKQQKPPPNKQAHKQPQQQPQSVSKDEMKGKWKQQIGAAKVAWGKLTDDELMKTEGHSQKLAGLVQERYAITRDEADKQVEKFMDNNKH